MEQESDVPYTQITKILSVVIHINTMLISVAYAVPALPSPSANPHTQTYCCESYIAQQNQ